MAIVVHAHAAQSYYPLKPGQIADFRYTVTNEGVGAPSMSGLLSFKPQAPRDLKGKTVIPIIMTALGERTTNGSLSLTLFSFYVEDATGVYEYATQGPENVEPVISATPKYFIKYPVKVGAHWENKDITSILMITPVTITNTIESVKEVVTTPMGTYKHCLLVKGVGRTGTITNELGILTQINVQNIYWYAPGVGLVQALMTETNNGYNPMLKQKFIVSGQWEQRLQLLTPKP